LLKRIYPAGQIVWRLNSPVGDYARAWQVPAGETARFQLDRAVAANFGDRAELIGVELPANAKPGDTVKMRLAFENRQVFGQLYKVFVHLRGLDNALVAQADRALCDLALNEADWRPGDVLVDEYKLTVPPDAQPGDYPVVIGFYQDTTGTRLPVVAADIEHDKDSATVGILHVR